MDKTGLTAIGRADIPLPTNYLYLTRRLLGKVLDYGCGKCHEVNRRFVPNIEGWDPNHRPTDIGGRLYHTIICNYVLNVIESPQIRRAVLCDIDLHLEPEGKAYISVRNDIKTDYRTKKGTWQGVIHLPYELVHKQSGYRMYAVKKGFSNA